MKNLVSLIAGSVTIVIIVLLSLLYIPSRQPTKDHSPGMTSIPSWSANLPEKRPNTSDTYDVIVIGAGHASAKQRGGLVTGSSL